MSPLRYELFDEDARVRKEVRELHRAEGATDERHHDVLQEHPQHADRHHVMKDERDAHVHRSLDIERDQYRVVYEVRRGSYDETANGCEIEKRRCAAKDTAGRVDERDAVVRYARLLTPRREFREDEEEKFEKEMEESEENDISEKVREQHCFLYTS